MFEHESAPFHKDDTEKAEKDENPREAYFLLMKQCSLKVHERLNEYINQFEHIGEISKYETLHKQMLELPEARMGKNLLRSVLTELMFRLNKGNNEIDMVPALIISELNNINAYLDNIILDNKKDIWNDKNAREKISEHTITSGMFRELTEKVILELKTSDSNKIKIMSSLSECLAKSYQGQQLDLETGVNEIDSFSNDQAYLLWYLNKSKLQSAYLYGFSAKIGAILAEAPEEKIIEAEKIGQAIGLGLHISNDLGDFAVENLSESTGFKYYQDQLADLKNGRLTFPIYYVMKYGSKQEVEIFKEIINNEALSQKNLLAASKVIHTSGVFNLGKKIIRKYYNNANKIIRDNSPVSQERDMLLVMSSVIRTNKFLVSLRDVG